MRFLIVFLFLYILIFIYYENQDNNLQKCLENSQLSAETCAYYLQ